MIKSFKSEVYPIEITFCMSASIEEIVDGCYKKFQMPKERLLEELSELRNAFAFCYANGGGVIISVPSGTNAHRHGVLSHEISHATFFICDRIGIDTTVLPQEAYCYLNGWIVERIYKLINK